MRRVGFITTAALAVAALVAISATPAAHAAAWYVRAGASGTGAIDNPFGKIQPAITVAASGDTIAVAEGTYVENLTISGKSLTIQGGWSSDFAERDWEKHLTTVDGNKAGNCFKLTSCPTGGEVSGFTITNGKGNGAGIRLQGSSPVISANTFVANAGGSASSGGGIYCSGGSPVISRNTFTANSAVDGGAIYFTSSPLAMITDNIFSANATGSTGHGGGIYCSGGSPVISKNTFTANSAVNGGAIYFISSSLAMVTDNVITGNLASGNGGGICSSGSSPTISGNTFALNGADYSGGGVHYSYLPAPALVANNIFTVNTAKTEGGGACVGDPTLSESPTVTISGNVFTGNTSSSRGGGLYCHVPVIVTNSVFSSNRALNDRNSGVGGGIYVHLPLQPKQPCSFTNCVISDNSADKGGGVCADGFISSTTFLSNCILWRNDASIGAEVWLSSPKIASIRYCDVAGGAERCYPPVGTGIDWQAGNIDADPLFADPEHGDYHLKSIGGRWDPAANAGAGGWVIDAVHSPCIDAGDPASPFSNEPAPNGGRANIGVYGNTAQASKSYTGPTRTLTVRSTPINGVPIHGTYVGTTDFTASAVPGTDAVIYGWRSGAMFFLRWEDENGTLLSGKGKLALRMDADKTVVAVYGPVADFYVNDATAENGIAAGDDANPGTSPEYPMDSIQKLLNRYGDLGTGCTMHVSAGTFTENIALTQRNNDLVLQGAGPGLTIINGNRKGSCIMGHLVACTISGFTFTNGKADYAGGVHFCFSTLTLSNCLVVGNEVTSNMDLGGAGIYCYHTTATITNCTSTGNSATGTKGGGTRFLSGATATLTNCIIWGNSASIGPEISIDSATATFRFCDVAGGTAAADVTSGTLTWGDGNIDADPLFADPAQSDYHLKSAYGRWDPKADSGNGAWVNDAVSSPCIDAGDPASDYSKEPQPNSARINMGSHGNTPEASKSKWTILGDANGDCTVNVLDLFFLRNRLNQSPTTGDVWKADVNNDGSPISVIDLIYVRDRLNNKCK